jgi:uncharacterized protein YbjQ (UPF0145 family)
MFIGMGGNDRVEFNGLEYCKACADVAKDKAFAEAMDGIPITTTHNLDGYKITKYIDIESVEIVIGTGLLSEFGGNISDFLGNRSKGFEKKGNAVVGIDLDFTEFSGNRIGLIVNGTIVSTKPD